MLSNGNGQLETELEYEELSPEAREAMKAQMRERLFTPEDAPDLREYRREQQRSEETSFLTKMVSTYKFIVGRTPEKEHSKLLSNAKRTHAQLSRGYDQYEAEFVAKSDETGVIGQEFQDAESYLRLCMRDYREIQSRVDMLEAELESLGDSSRLNTTRLEVQQQLTHARKQKIKIDREASEAARKYQERRTQYTMLVSQTDNMRGHLDYLLSQKTNVGIVIDNARLQSQLVFSSKGPSLKSMYEEAALAANDLGNFSSDKLGDNPVFDENYLVSVGKQEPDALLEEWNQLRKS